jgi:hypothetical protein
MLRDELNKSETAIESDRAVNPFDAITAAKAAPSI